MYTYKIFTYWKTKSIQCVGDQNDCDYSIKEEDAIKLIDTLEYFSRDRHASESINHFSHAGA